MSSSKVGRLLRKSVWEFLIIEHFLNPFANCKSILDVRNKIKQVYYLSWSRTAGYKTKQSYSNRHI
jgi:hypothetical protein